MRVVVTGGCGFIGSTVVRSLTAGGHDVVVIDDLSMGARNNLPSNVRLVQGSIMNRDVVREALKGAGVVVHLAGIASVLESVSDPWPSFQVNVGGTLVLLHESARADVEGFVLASSNAVVGQQGPPVEESLIPQPVSPYGASKAAAEAYCCAFSRQGRLRAVSLRFANAYGPFCERKDSVVSKFVRRLVARQPIPIYGDGRQTRDFIHVQDIANAISLAIESRGVDGVFHVATGIETSIIQLLDALVGVTGLEPDIDWRPQPPGEVRQNYSDISKARRVLGFEPRIPLATGLQNTYRWIAEHPQIQSSG